MDSEERVFLLSGSLTCGECGRALVGSSNHNAKSVYRYYVHRKIENEPKTCSIKTIRADSLEQKILEHLDKRLSEDGYLVKLGERALELKQTQSKDEISEKEIRRLELAQVEKDIENAFVMLGGEGSSDKIIQLCKVRLEKLEDKKQKIESRIEELNFKIQTAASAVHEMALVQQSLLQFQKVKKTGSRNALKRIIRKVFLNIRVEAGRLGLSYWTTSDAELVGFTPEMQKATEQNSVAFIKNPLAFTSASRDKAVSFLQFKGWI